MDEEHEDEEAPVDPPPTVKKKARSRSKSVARSEVTDNTEVEVEITESRKPSRSRSKKPAAESEVEVEEEVVRKSSRSKFKASVAPSVTEDEALRKPSRTRPKAKAIESEQEELPLVTPKPKHKRAVSRSKSKAPAEPLVADSEPEAEVLTVAPKPKYKRTVSRSKSRAPVEPSDVDSEPEPEVILVVPKQKHKRTVSRSRSKAPVEPSEIESEPETKVVTAGPKPKHKRTVSRSKPKAPVEPSEIDSEPGAEVLTAAPKPKHKRAVSRSKSKAPVEPSEIDSGLEAEVVKNAPPKKASSKTKIQIFPAEDLFNDDVVMDNYVPPPSSPPPAPSHTSTTELPPLFVPKRNAKPTVQPQVAAEESHPIEKEKKKPGRPKAKPQLASRPQSVKVDVNEQPTASFSTDTSGPLTPLSINPPQPPLKENKPMGKAKPSASHHPETQVTKMKVVEISSDEEDNIVIESDRDMKSKAAPLRGKENTQTSSAKPPPYHDSRPTSAQGKHEKKPVVVEVVQSQAVKPPSKQTSERLVTPAPAPPPAPEADDDVNMDMAEDGAHPGVDGNTTYDLPKTPERPKGRVSPHEVSIEAPAPPTEKDAAEPLFVPALSKLPFIPITTLSEAELDMTVEDWIRYQMDAEFDKLRRDGERELERFRKKAEDTRKIIESL